MREHIVDVVMAGLAACLTLFCVAIYTHVPDWRGMIALGVLVSYVASITMQLNNHFRNR